MKLQVLGTSAAPTWPDIFTGSEYCDRIRTLRGKNIRSRSQAVIDDVYLIDFGPDNFYHSVKFGVDFSQIKSIFVTHSHKDHFIPYELEFAQGCFAYNYAYDQLYVYGNEKVTGLAKEYENDVVKPVTVYPYNSVITKDGYKWTAIPASHSEHEDALNYIIEHEGKTLLYKVDSGAYTDEKLWDFLKDFRFDCIVTECTFTFEKTRHWDHETYDSVLELKEKLKSLNCIREETPFWLTHIHHIAGGLSHDEMEEITAKDNIHVCYDGVIIEF